MVNISRTPLLIIGAALPRTATTSTKMALEKLGYKVWHYTSMSPRMHEIWEEFVPVDLANNRERRQELMNTFVEQLSIEGFNVTLDQPSCFVYQELMEIYPKAKVLNTQRSSAEAWAKSMLEMQYAFDLLIHRPPFNIQPTDVRSPFFRWSKEQLGIPLQEVHKEGLVHSSDPLEQKSSVSMATAIRVYEQYQARVQEVVPKDRLVEFRATEGYRKLCQHFLPEGYTCPTDEPFPFENTKDRGFLLDYRKLYAARVNLYAIHPYMDQPWLVNGVIFWMDHYQDILLGLAVAVVSTVLLLKRRFFWG